MFNKIGKGKNKKRGSDFLEPEEVIFGNQSRLEKNKQDDFNRLEVSFGEWGVRSIAWLGGAILLLTLILIFNHNIIRGDYFQSQARNNSRKFILTPADRGVIYDRFNKVLASDSLAFDLIFVPNSLPTDRKEREKELKEIRANIEMSDEDWNRITNFKPAEFFGGLVLKSNLSPREVIYFESRLANLSSVSVIKQSRREYKNPEVFSHLLGYLGRASESDLANNPDLSSLDKVGQSGLEKEYDDVLRGVSGKVAFSRDAKMEVLGKSVAQESKNGVNLQTTIDSEFQTFLYNRLKNQIETLNIQGGGAAAIAMDSQTGEILANVSYPGFDIEALSSGLSQEEFGKLLNSPAKPLFNRTISGLYSPGSTIKPIIAAAALEEKIITPEKQIVTHGYLSIPNRYNPDQPTIFKDWKNHGTVNMYSAIAVSSNVYFYTLGGGFENFKGLGIDKIAEYLSAFQFDRSTEIGLIGENVGFVPTPANKENGSWGIADTYHTSIGQGDVLVSPIRLITSLNSLVNGGKILKPKLVFPVSATTDQDEKDKKEELLIITPEVQKEIPVSPENLAEIKKAMVQTIKSPLGTGHTLVDLPFSVGGKSGTSQVFNNTQLNALFFAFAPVENPKISLLILIEKAHDGGGNATPVARDALLWYYQNRGLK